MGRIVILVRQCLSLKRNRKMISQLVLMPKQCHVWCQSLLLARYYKGTCCNFIPFGCKGKTTLVLGHTEWGRVIWAKRLIFWIFFFSYFVWQISTVQGPHFLLKKWNNKFRKIHSQKWKVLLRVHSGRLYSLTNLAGKIQIYDRSFNNF